MADMLMLALRARTARLIVNTCCWRPACISSQVAFRITAAVPLWKVTVGFPADILYAGLSGPAFLFLKSFANSIKRTNARAQVPYRDPKHMPRSR
jgi:hypothetical protein